jgi:hypothetical protein
MRADIVPGGIGPDYELWGARDATEMQAILRSLLLEA